MRTIRYFIIGILFGITLFKSEAAASDLNKVIPNRIPMIK